MTKKLLNSIKKSLNDLILSFFDGNITEEDLLKELNKATHYNKTYTPYIYEMLYIQALELEKIPKSKAILAGMFKNIDTECFLLPEDYNLEGTRIKVLKRLNLNKTLKMYKQFLICNHEEPHTLFKEGEKDPIYLEAVENNPSINYVFKCLMEEAK